MGKPDGPTGTDSSGYLRTSETEEELQLRLIQLLNLPVQTNASVSPAGLAQDYSVLGSQINSQFITLDCCSLADSLSCLPVHKRLDISAHLLELGGYADEFSSKRETSTEESSSLTHRNEIELANVDSTSDRVQNVTVISGIQNEGKGFNFQVSPQTAAKTVPEAKSMQPSSVEKTETLPHTDLGGDTELDHLLQQSSTTIDTVKFVIVENKQDVITNVQCTHPSSALPQPVHETDELDDMLDELLSV